MLHQLPKQFAKPTGSPKSVPKSGPITRNRSKPFIACDFGLVSARSCCFDRHAGTEHTYAFAVWIVSPGAATLARGMEWEELVGIHESTWSWLGCLHLRIMSGPPRRLKRGHPTEACTPQGTHMIQVSLTLSTCFLRLGRNRQFLTRHNSNHVCFASAQKKTLGPRPFLASSLPTAARPAPKPRPSHTRGC